LRGIGKEVEQIVINWTKDAKTEWCRVREARPEIVIERDQASAISLFKDQTVSLWGCGALGSFTAEYLVRAGIKKIILRDKGVVAPGVISRQLYDDADVGKNKAAALALRLKRIRTDVRIEVEKGSILNNPLDKDSWFDDSDIVIDTTASTRIVHKLELKRRTSKIDPVPIISIMIGHLAKNGIVTLVLPQHVGATYDVYRRAKLQALKQSGQKKFADEFWPNEPRRDLFQPEPGCSDPTFVGSAADVAALAGMMINCAAAHLHDTNSSSTAFAHFVSQPHIMQDAGSARSDLSTRWEADHIVEDSFAGYQVRISKPAWNEMLGWINRSRRVNGPGVEPGGILF
jgi:molybdopterin/thiamine biosynthesis adenylyltransferase